MARRRNRMWSAEEKRSICQQTRAPGVSMAQVGRCYALNVNLIHKWLRDPHFALNADDGTEELPVDGVSGAPSASSVVLPVELVAEAAAEADGSVPPHDDSPAVSPGGVLEITLAGGHRLRIEGAYDPDALARLLLGLTGLAS